MTSFKGFLQSPGPDRPPRMTAKQRAAVEVAVRAALAPREDVFAGSIEDQVRELALGVVVHYLTNYPQDHSCWTCDFLFVEGRRCRHFSQDVPAEYLDRGCDHHQGHGAPF